MYYDETIYLIKNQRMYDLEGEERDRLNVEKLPGLAPPGPGCLAWPGRGNRSSLELRSAEREISLEPPANPQK